MPVPPSPAIVEGLIDATFAAADARRAAGTARLRHIGRVTARTHANSAAAEELLQRAFGSGAVGPDAPFDLDVIDDDAAHPRPPDLWAHVSAEAQGRADGAKAYWQQGSQRLLAFADTGALAAFDGDARRAVMWYRSVARLPGYEQAAPMRDLLHWMHAASGSYLIHGAAVATPAGGVLIVGPGGRGKSTLATTALLLGFSFAGDDYIALDPSARRAHGVYLSVKVLAEDLPRYARALPHRADAAPEPGEKVPLFLPSPPPGFHAGLPLVAVAVPTRTTPWRGWQPLGRAQTLTALAPSTLFQTSGDREATFAACGRIVRELASVAWNPGPLDEGFPARVAAELTEIAHHGARA
jgi:hypothetical protein